MSKEVKKTLKLSELVGSHKKRSTVNIPNILTGEDYPLQIRALTIYEFAELMADKSFYDLFAGKFDNLADLSEKVVTKILLKTIDDPNVQVDEESLKDLPPHILMEILSEVLTLTMPEGPDRFLESLAKLFEKISNMVPEDPKKE
jgi:hypothetical protein